jgi:AcrR family transcriptional regulator
MAKSAGPRSGHVTDGDEDKRTRILHAAMETFGRHGFAAATTLEIATRARVSKRELYVLVGNKQEMLKACIAERVRQFAAPADVPAPRDRKTLAHVLAAFGTRLVREVSDPAVIAVFRLAIGEAVNAPEVAQTLESAGREPARAALLEIMNEARAAGLLEGRPDALAEQFRGLLWTDLMVGLLLGVTERPSAAELAHRARDAAEAFLALHPARTKHATPRR